MNTTVIQIIEIYNSSSAGDMQIDLHFLIVSIVNEKLKCDIFVVF